MGKKEKPSSIGGASSGLGEHGIIELMRGFFEPMPELSVPFGDDVSAVPLAADEGDVAVLKADMLVGKTDVPRGMSLWQAARKAVVMNVSDFAAKGVQPKAALVSLGLPRKLMSKDFEEIAKGLKKDYVLIKGMGLAITYGYFSMAFQEDNDFLGFKATREASAMAYRQAGIENPRKEINVAEVHDCFTITELVNYEDLGFCARGEGGKLIEEGFTALTGDLPVNTSGGLKSCGHPVGATGVRMVADVVDQMRGRAGKRQVKKADFGLTHTLGGPGSIACVFVLGRP